MFGYTPFKIYQDFVEISFGNVFKMLENRGAKNMQKPPTTRSGGGSGGMGRTGWNTFLKNSAMFFRQLKSSEKVLHLLSILVAWTPGCLDWFIIRLQCTRCVVMCVGSK